MNVSKILIASQSVSMLGWALNEEENIKEYVQKAHGFLSQLTADYELIVIDDGSTDSTYDALIELQSTRPWLKIHKNNTNKGSGYNTKKAISLASKDYLFWQTVDWSYDISSLKTSWKLLEIYDVLQGTRHCETTLFQRFFLRSDNLYKGIVSFINYALIRILFQIPFTDYQNVTVYPTKLIQSVRLESKSSFSNPECLLKTWWKGATFKEISIPFIKRQKGESKGTKPLAIAQAISQILYFWIRWSLLRLRSDFQSGHIDY